MADLACFAIAGWVLAASLVSGVLTVLDKGRARAGRRRVRERMLLGWSFVGGWPGMALAMVLVRHKTRKAAFLLPFLVFAVANAGILWAVGRGFSCWP